MAPPITSPGVPLNIIIVVPQVALCAKLISQNLHAGSTWLHLTSTVLKKKLFSSGGPHLNKIFLHSSLCGNLFPHRSHGYTAADMVETRCFEAAAHMVPVDAGFLNFGPLLLLAALWGIAINFFIKYWSFSYDIQMTPTYQALWDIAINFFFYIEHFYDIQMTPTCETYPFW